MCNTSVYWFCVVHSCWLSSCHRRSWVTTTLHREPDMRRYPDPQHLWWHWQSFCSCRSRAMEQFTATSQRYWLTTQSVAAVTKDIFGWWGHGAVGTILTVPSRNYLTYLLNYSNNRRMSKSSTTEMISLLNVNALLLFILETLLLIFLCLRQRVGSIIL